MRVCIGEFLMTTGNGEAAQPSVCAGNGEIRPAVTCRLPVCLSSSISIYIYLRIYYLPFTIYQSTHTRAHTRVHMHTRTRMLQRNACV